MMQAALELIQAVESGVLDPNSLCELGQVSLCQGLSVSICKKKSWTRCFLRVFGVIGTLILGVFACWVIGARLNPLGLHSLDHHAPCCPVARYQSCCWHLPGETLDTCQTYHKPAAYCEISKLTEVEKWLLFHFWKLHSWSMLSNVSFHLFVQQMFPSSSFVPGLCDLGTWFLPLRNTQSRKGKTGHRLLSIIYNRKRGTEKMLQTFNYLATVGLSIPWNCWALNPLKLIWLRSANRWLYWVEQCLSEIHVYLEPVHVI